MTSPASILCQPPCYTQGKSYGLIGSIVCPSCHESQYRSHGYYTRYFPDDPCDTEIRVPRYLCLVPSCERKTFSILPFPCLRYKRHTLSFFFMLTTLAAIYTVNQLAHQFQRCWKSLRRLIRHAELINVFFRNERRRAGWAPCPCSKPEQFWTEFTVSQSWATVPGPD